MCMDSITDIYVRLYVKKDMYFPPAATLTDIEEFEKENNIGLPKQYKQWLELTDGGDLYLPAGIQFYGVNNNPLIEVNEKISLGNDYIIMGKLASGDPLVFRNGSEEILIFNQTDNRIEDDESYSSFYEFLVALEEILGIEE